jgi:DNA-binding NarL/FixJ family response regulator
MNTNQETIKKAEDLSRFDEFEIGGQRVIVVAANPNKRNGIVVTLGVLKAKKKSQNMMTLILPKKIQMTVTTMKENVESEPTYLKDEAPREVRNKRILEMHKDGLSNKDIAKLVGLHETTVYSIIRRLSDVK